MELVSGKAGTPPSVFGRLPENYLFPSRRRMILSEMCATLEKQLDFGGKLLCIKKFFINQQM
jgi:hypothetical protein